MIMSYDCKVVIMVKIELQLFRVIKEKRQQSVSENDKVNMGSSLSKSGT